VVSHRRLPLIRRPGFSGSHLSCACTTKVQHQAAVRLHGVFRSCGGYRVSSLGTQLRRVSLRDSGPVVTPFVQVTTYVTRNFAHLHPRFSPRGGPYLQPDSRPISGKRSIISFFISIKDVLFSVFIRRVISMISINPSGVKCLPSSIL
jgi:hypothetical protein